MQAVKKLIVVLALFVSTVSYADQGDIDVILTGPSVHFTPRTGPNGHYNDYNWGGGISVEPLQDVIIKVGENNNSLYNKSQWVSLEYRFLRVDNFDFSVSETRQNGYTSTYQYTSHGQQYTSVTGSNTIMSTNLMGCYTIDVTESHKPQVCALIPVIQSNTNQSFKSVSFSVRVPLFNFLD